MSTNEAEMAAVQRVLRSEEQVRWAYVFGSVARGTAWRDVDVAVMFRDGSGIGGTAFGGLAARLEESAGATVDLVDLEQPSCRSSGRYCASARSSSTTNRRRGGRGRPR